MKSETHSVGDVLLRAALQLRQAYAEEQRALEVSSMQAARWEAMILNASIHGDSMVTPQAIPQVEHAWAREEPLQTSFYLVHVEV